MTSSASSSSSSAVIDEADVEKKFSAVKNSQESIQSLSLWALHHKARHEQIVDIWFNVFKKSTVAHRLSMLYLCNDIVQTCKRKHAVMYKDSFKDVLRDAALLVRDSTVRGSVERIFSIWEERGIYDGEFVEELISILNSTDVKPAMTTKLLADFKPSKLRDIIGNFSSLEKEIEVKRRKLSTLNLDLSTKNYMKLLKDRNHGRQYTQQVEESYKALTSYVASLTIEAKDRAAMLEALEQSELFYEAQYGEARIVVNAYKNFGTRVNNFRRKLDDITKLLPEPLSPIPSPTMDAPSPAASPPPPDTEDNTEMIDMDLSDGEHEEEKTLKQGESRVLSRTTLNDPRASRRLTNPASSTNTATNGQASHSTDGSKSKDTDGPSRAPADVANGKVGTDNSKQFSPVNAISQESPVYNYTSPQPLPSTSLPSASYPDNKQDQFMSLEGLLFLPPPPPPPLPPAQLLATEPQDSLSNTSVSSLSLASASTTVMQSFKKSDAIFPPSFSSPVETSQMQLSCTLPCSTTRSADITDASMSDSFAAVSTVATRAATSTDDAASSLAVFQTRLAIMTGLRINARDTATKTASSADCSEKGGQVVSSQLGNGDLGGCIGNRLESETDVTSDAASSVSSTEKNDATPVSTVNPLELLNQLLNKSRSIDAKGTGSRATGIDFLKSLSVLTQTVKSQIQNSAALTTTTLPTAVYPANHVKPFYHSEDYLSTTSSSSSSSNKEMTEDTTKRALSSQRRDTLQSPKELMESTSADFGLYSTSSNIRTHDAVKYDGSEKSELSPFSPAKRFKSDINHDVDHKVSPVSYPQSGLTPASIPHYTSPPYTTSVTVSMNSSPARPPQYTAMSYTRDDRSPTLSPSLASPYSDDRLYVAHGSDSLSPVPDVSQSYITWEGESGVLPDYEQSSYRQFDRCSDGATESLQSQEVFVENCDTFAVNRTDLDRFGHAYDELDQNTGNSYNMENINRAEAFEDGELPDCDDDLGSGHPVVTYTEPLISPPRLLSAHSSSFVPVPQSNIHATGSEVGNRISYGQYHGQTVYDRSSESIEYREMHDLRHHSSRDAGLDNHHFIHERTLHAGSRLNFQGHRVDEMRLGPYGAGQDVGHEFFEGDEGDMDPVGYGVQQGCVGVMAGDIGSREDVLQKGVNRTISSALLREAGYTNSGLHSQHSHETGLYVNAVREQFSGADRVNQSSRCGVFNNDHLMHRRQRPEHREQLQYEPRGLRNPDSFTLGAPGNYFPRAASHPQMGRIMRGGGEVFRPRF